MNPQSKDLERLIHDVNSKCASLTSAAALLKQASPKEAQELLVLMSEEVRKLARTVMDFEESQHAGK